MKHSMKLLEESELELTTSQSRAHNRICSDSQGLLHQQHKGENTCNAQNQRGGQLSGAALWKLDRTTLPKFKKRHWGDSLESL